MTWDGETEAIGDDANGFPVQRIGPYRLIQRLGEGGMGVVHLALDRAGRAVAIKVLRPHIAEDAGARVRLAREVETMQRVRSPHVAPIIDADVSGEQPYVVTRYVPGHTLDHVVAEGGPLPPRDVHRLATGLTEALHAIHAAGVVHRDLKPTNVMVVDGDPVLIDFGIAHLTGDSRLTATGLVMGTPGYLAPELVDGGEVTPATDWWGWAATVTFAAGGQPPFGRGAMDVVIARVMRGEPQLASVDARIAPLLYAALSPRPADRPHHDQIVAALDRYAHGSPVTEVIQERRPAPTQALPVHGPVPSVAARALPPAPPARPVPAAPPGPPGPQSPPVPSVSAGHRVPAAGAWPAAVPRTAPPGALPLPPPRPSGEADVAAIPTPALAIDPRIGLPDRRGLLAAVGVLLVALATAAPVLSVIVLALLMVVARTVDRVLTSVVIRRHTRGDRDKESLVAALTSPVHLVLALAASAVAMVIPVLVGACAVLATSLALASSTWPPLARTLVGLVVGGVFAVVTAWWGPGGVPFRRGARSCARGLAPEGRLSRGVAVILAVVAVALVAWTWSRGAPVWAPLPGPPEVFATTLGQP